MKSLDFCNKTIKLFHSFLTHSFFRCIRECLSEAGTINCGVSQRSILGLVLFLLYINHFRQALSNDHTYLYADHTTICYRRNNVSEIENVLNKKYVKACNWFVDNKLFVYHFVEYKTKCILFSMEKTFQNITQYTITIK